MAENKDKKGVEIKDLPKKDELKDKDLDKVSGGCGGMSQDPAGSFKTFGSRTKLSQAAPGPVVVGDHASTGPWRSLTPEFTDAE